MRTGSLFGFALRGARNATDPELEPGAFLPQPARVVAARADHLRRGEYVAPGHPRDVGLHELEPVLLVAERSVKEASRHLISGERRAEVTDDGGCPRTRPEIDHGRCVAVRQDQIRAEEEPHSEEREGDRGPPHGTPPLTLAVRVREGLVLRAEAGCVESHDAVGVLRILHRPRKPQANGFGGLSAATFPSVGGDVLAGAVHPQMLRLRVARALRGRNGFGRTIARAMPELTAEFDRALLLAARIHRGQFRKGSDIPYLTHLMSVAALVLEDGGDESQAIAALLHDALEDTAVTAEEIEAEFGATVRAIVVGCTDTTQKPKPPWRPRKQAYVEHLRDESDPGTLRVALADKLHNARAILADYRVVGDELWSRFNAGRTDVLWFQRSLADLFRDQRVLASPMIDELDRVVSGLERLVSRA